MPLASPTPGDSIVNKKVGVAFVTKGNNAQWITEQNQYPVIGNICQLHKEGKLVQYQVTATGSPE